VPGVVELITVVPRKHMHVVMPRVLIPSRLVVLPRRHPVAVVGAFHADGNLPYDVMHGVPVDRRQVIEVLMVLGRHDEHMPAVVRPPP